MDGEIVNEVPKEAQPVNVAATVNLAPQEHKAFIPNFVARKPIKVLNTDGTYIGMEQPKVSITQFVHNCFKDVEFKDSGLRASAEMKLTALLHVTDIDGKLVDKVSSYLDMLDLEQKLGIDGVDLVQFAWMECFPPITRAQLVIVGK